MDNKDRKIIDVLKENSRFTIKELSLKTKLRPSTIHQRIQKLIKNEVIEKFSIKLDDKVVGENFIVYVLINTEGDIPNEHFRKKEIKEVFGVTGEYDLMMKCKFSDIEAFNSFLLEFRKLPMIKKTVTMVATTKIKED
jgi:DNA-binding Lrp family transcriptional regulator